VWATLLRCELQVAVLLLFMAAPSLCCAAAICTGLATPAINAITGRLWNKVMLLLLLCRVLAAIVVAAPPPWVLLPSWVMLVVPKVPLLVPLLLLPGWLLMEMLLCMGMTTIVVCSLSVMVPIVTVWSVLLVVIRPLCSLCFLLNTLLLQCLVVMSHVTVNGRLLPVAATSVAALLVLPACVLLLLVPALPRLLPYLTAGVCSSWCCGLCTSGMLHCLLRGRLPSRH
jgi:hypothetical protein